MSCPAEVSMKKFYKLRSGDFYLFIKLEDL